MNKKHIIAICISGVFITVLEMAICFFFFPKYICQTINIVNTSEIVEESWFKVSEKMSLSEEFNPNYQYLECINIHVGENEEGNLLLGRLTDEKGKVLEEHIMKAKKGFVSFQIQRWVSKEKKYVFLVEGCEGNKGEIPITFGETVVGSVEHISSWVGDDISKGVLWTQYVYHTYSKKLLLAWFFVFMTISFMILDTFWKKYFVK